MVENNMLAFEHRGIATAHSQAHLQVLPQAQHKTCKRACLSCHRTAETSIVPLTS